MKKIILAGLLTSVAASAQAASVTYSFNLSDSFFAASGPADPIQWGPDPFPSDSSGSGILTFDEKAESEATAASANDASYSHAASLEITVNGVTYPLFSDGLAVVYHNVPTADSGFRFFNAADTFSLLIQNGPSEAFPTFDLTKSNFDLAESRPFFGGNLIFSHTIFRATNFAEVAAPVPEPGEWAMIAAGLAIVGGLARRRRATRIEA